MSSRGRSEVAYPILGLLGSQSPAAARKVEKSFLMSPKPSIESASEHPRAELTRRLSLADSIAIVVGMRLGGGIFIVPNLVARSLHSMAERDSLPVGRPASLDSPPVPLGESANI